MVKIIARKLALRLNSCVEIDDLVQDGMIGLLDAINRHDGEFGDQFKNYACMRIRGEMFDGLRRLDPVTVYMRRKIGEEARYLHEDIDDHEINGCFDNQFDVLAIFQTVNALSDREKQIIEMRINEMNLRDIGRVLGVSESRVCQIQKSIVEKIYHA